MREGELVVLDRDALENIRNIRSVDTVVTHGIRYRHSDYRPYTPSSARARELNGVTTQ